jgi:LmbE family N-acetylglucosaminyl deacetylase
MRLILTPLLALGLLLPQACESPAAMRAGQVEPVTDRATAAGPRVLAVTAHPDDETGFAATLYALTHLLDATCDVLLVTNGEGGFKYASLAEPIYGAELTREEVGRALLPAIRRDEMLAGCRLLGVREVQFLGERDHRYTTDEREVLAPDAGVWDLERVRAALARRLEAGDYDLVLVLLPTEGTHGHHKAATILALEAVAALPLERRPAALGATVLEQGQQLAYPPGGLAGWEVTRPRADAPPLSFDRLRPLGYQGRLDWRVVVHWVIAEHKSQGTMQLAMGRGAREAFTLFEVSPPEAGARCALLFQQLATAEAFPGREYGPSAGTNVQPAAR